MRTIWLLEMMLFTAVCSRKRRPPLFHPLTHHAEEAYALFYEGQRSHEDREPDDSKYDAHSTHGSGIITGIIGNSNPVPGMPQHDNHGIGSGPGGAYNEEEKIDPEVAEQNHDNMMGSGNRRPLNGGVM